MQHLGGDRFGNIPELLGDVEYEDMLPLETAASTNKEVDREHSTVPMAPLAWMIHFIRQTHSFRLYLFYFDTHESLKRRQSFNYNSL